ncbi:AprI/Inh family metalloprotease inhibitor [Pseudomonas protegens]|uniref:AprI/Inh family metalloprotease inhibitor n=1 Tax=Pseudomonas protegens TaxID=380021 RepID=UPI00069EBF5C|nr:AprI/Inh family metalloprotease inhibitor [Pseudomonas protegens]MBP5096817.1 protease inhibitor Inh/omp19 family protein [Pseudomonas protegens]MBP5119980.1 protease inhibitor Inh/omp19 family protein [Pseudomonas protegens]MBP5122355.1 protease inhibitor Inh/omp19 family protein [Pseudomonas protegens]MCU1769124.1 protease inhibitor Inh/omp19 family protein [Pseudomonas protegens]QTU07213.1 protease inhibitor Inh/omp19 family protein [Pseudomonas protegens]
MTLHIYCCRAARWLLATLMIFYGAITMASSLRLADPSELVGHWQLQQAAAPAEGCTLDLLHNAALGDGADCLSKWLGEAAVGWFPEPDGIAITGREGSKIIFFSRQKEGLYEARLKADGLIVLQRAAN